MRSTQLSTNWINYWEAISLPRTGPVISMRLERKMKAAVEQHEQAHVVSGSAADSVTIPVKGEVETQNARTCAAEM